MGDEALEGQLQVIDLGGNNQTTTLPDGVVPISSTVQQADPLAVPCPCGSGKSFIECHGAAAAPKPIVEEPKGKLLRLDLGAGQNPREGFEAVDVWAGAQHKVDLFKFPWPWSDGTVEELHCSHFVEHIPDRPVEERDLLLDHRNPQMIERYVDADFLFAFFDECYRILAPGGKMKVIVPALRSDRAFQDPTHRRFIPPMLFWYLNKQWRKDQKLDHYKVVCDFAHVFNYTFPTELQAQCSPEAFQRRLTESWNIALDWHFDLVRLPLPG